VKSSSWIRLLAKRWFLTGRNGRLPALSVLPAAGMAVGVAALIVVLGVMNGFQGGYIDSILEVSSFHIRIEGSPGEDPLAVSGRLASAKGVRSALPFRDLRCLCSSATHSATIVSLRSLPADAFTRDPGMAAALGLSGRSMPGTGRVILGSELARSLDVAVGDTITLLGVVTDPDEGAATKTVSVRVEALFRSGYFEFDSRLVLADFSTSERMAVSLPGGKVSYGVKLDDRYADARAMAAIAMESGIAPARMQSWRAFNRAFFGALRTEKTVMMLLVGLIFLVVGVNIHHAMRRNVAQRTVEIAVLRAMGGRASDIAFVFLLEGLAVGLAGAALGLAAGLAIVYNINGIFELAASVAGWFMGIVASLTGAQAGDYRIFSPQYFYIIDVPVRVSFAESAFIAFAAIASSAFAAGSAASRLSRLDPAQVLRYE
jgi:lipoprotein-releasing system permease protein